MMQQDLFTLESVTARTEPREVAGKRLISRLNKVRKSLSPAEREFDAHLAKAIKEIRTVCALSDEKRKELIMHCVESSHAHTVAEIAEDCHLSKDEADALIVRLLDGGQLTTRERLVIGGSVKQTLIFSARNPCSCV